MDVFKLRERETKDPKRFTFASCFWHLNTFKDWYNYVGIWNMVKLTPEFEFQFLLFLYFIADPWLQNKHWIFCYLQCSFKRNKINLENHKSGCKSVIETKSCKLSPSLVETKTLNQQMFYFMLFLLEVKKKGRQLSLNQ